MNSLEGKVIVVIVILILAACILAYWDDIWWETHSNKHHCIQTKETRTTVIMILSGKVLVPEIITTKKFTCDDGDYWR